MTKRDMILSRVSKGIIDCHSHCGVLNHNFYKNIYPCTQSVEDLAMKMNIAGVDWSICFPMPNSSNSSSGSFSADDVPFEKVNEYFLMEVGSFGSKVVPFVYVHPLAGVERQCERIHEWSMNNEIYGMKFSCNGTGANIRDFKNSDLMSLLASNDWPILFHSSRSDDCNPLSALELSELYPGTRICVAHSGRFFCDFWDNVGVFDNVFVDISPFLLSCIDMTEFLSSRSVLDFDYSEPVKVLRGLYSLLPTRLLWGTDEPWTKISRSLSNNGSFKILGASYVEEKKFLDTIDDEIREAIAWDNPIKFLFNKGGS